MMERPQVQPGDGASAPPAQIVEAADLAELMRAFSDVTMRLEATHEGLRSEVSRLRAELGEANARLERSKRLAALGEMAAGIAHEVRNPLGSIGLYARLLEQDLVEQPPLREMAGRIRRSVIGLDAIVNDVLDFSRDVRIEAVPSDAWELMDRALEACGMGVLGAEDEMGVTIRRRGGDDAGITAKCDAGLMHQALVNVIRNALESMGESPGTHVLTLAVESRSGETVSLAVEDTGGGIPPEVQDRMFNPFFTTRRAGTGLGLAIVHRIIDAHGGAVKVSNVRDESGRVGARVELIVPAICGTGGLSASGVGEICATDGRAASGTHGASETPEALRQRDEESSTTHEPLALHAGFIKRRQVA